MSVSHNSYSETHGSILFVSPRGIISGSSGKTIFFRKKVPHLTRYCIIMIIRRIGISSLYNMSVYLNFKRINRSHICIHTNGRRVEDERT